MNEPMTEPTDVLTVAQAAELIGRTPGVLRRWIAAGLLPAHRPYRGPGAPWLIRPYDLAAVADRPTREGWSAENRAKRAERRDTATPAPQDDNLQTLETNLHAAPQAEGLDVERLARAFDYTLGDVMDDLGIPRDSDWTGRLARGTARAYAEDGREG